jgi:exonuclease III
VSVPRIDYQLATTQLAARVTSARIERAEAYA